MFVSIARLVAVLKQCRGENLEDRLMELKRAANLSAVTEKFIVVNLIKHLLVPLFGHVDLEKGYALVDVSVLELFIFGPPIKALHLHHAVANDCSPIPFIGNFCG